MLLAQLVQNAPREITINPWLGGCGLLLLTYILVLVITKRNNGGK